MLLGPWSRAVEPRWRRPALTSVISVRNTGIFSAIARNERRKRPTGKKHWKKGKKGGGGGGQQKWCSYHNTTNHADSECNKQKELRNVENYTLSKG